MPGLLGLIGMDKAGPAAMQQWTNQTLGWLGNWGGKFLGGLGSTIAGTDGSGGGILGFLGLQNSILSPNNPWTRAGTQGVEGIMQHFGAGGLPTGGLGDILSRLMSPNAGANPAVTAMLQSGQLDPSILNQYYNPGAAGVATIVTQGVAAPSGDIIAPNAQSRASTLGGAGVTYTPDFLAAHGISTLFMKNSPDASGGKTFRSGRVTSAPRSG